jgi:hypothetical protein
LTVINLPDDVSGARHPPLLIAVDTNKEVGDVDHLKVFATPELADEWLKENDPGRRRIRL